MAQIKKLQKGNVFTIDGVAHNVDDKLIGRLYDHAKSLDSGDAAQFGKIIDALRNGENISYDSIQNKLTGSVDWGLKNERQKRRVGKRLNHPGGLVADTQNAVAALKTFSPVSTSAASAAAKKEKTKKNWSKGHSIKYITGEDGKKRLAATVDNQMALNLLGTINEINGYGDDVEFLGYNGRNKDDYKAWIQARQGNSSIDNLRSRMESGGLTKEDWMYLNEIGITDGTEVNPDNENKERFKAAGLNWDKTKNYFTVDKDGNIFVTDAFKQTLGHNGNIWFNDEWQSWSPDLDFLRGKILYNGRLYNENEALDPNGKLRSLHAKNSFFDLVKRGKRKEANEIMQFSKDLAARERYDKNGPYYSEWMQKQNPNFWYSSLVGSHTATGLQDGQQLIKYYSGDRDQWGRLVGEKYAILDAQGNLVEDNVSADRISEIEDSEGPTRVNLVERIKDDGSYKGMVREDIGGGVDRGGFTLFSNPNTGELILDMGDHAYDRFGKWVGEGAVRIPKEMADEFNKMSKADKKRMWNKLIEDEQLRKNFIRSLNQLGETRVGNILRGAEHWSEYLKWLPGNVPGLIVDAVSTDPMSEDDWESLGFSRNLKGIIWNKLFDGSAVARRRKHFVEDYGTPRLQYGGTIGVPAMQHLPKTTVSSTKTPASAEELSEGKLNDADWWEIGSIAGNVAALVANMSAVGAPAAVGAGLLSTGAQLVSDIKRDGFQWGDIGSLAVNLGLDAATLLPNAGISSMAKIGKTLAKSAGLVKKVLMGVGAVRGVQGLTNILNGEGSLDDWKALSQGLLVGQRAIKTGRNIAATKYSPKNAKTAPQTKEGIQKKYIEEFIANNKDKVGTIKGVSADGKVTNLSEAKAELKNFEGFSLPDKIASLQAAGSRAKGTFSSKWNPFSDQFVLNSENRVLSPETLSAIKTGNSTWRANAAYELGHLNPAIHRQIYKAGMNLPRDFGFNDPYVGNWFFRAPVFTKNGYTVPVAKTTVATTSSTPLLLPPHEASVQPSTPINTKASVVPPTYVAPVLTTETVSVPKMVAPVAPVTSLVPVAPTQPPVLSTKSGITAEMLQQLRQNPQFMAWLYNSFFGGRLLPASKQTTLLPIGNVRYSFPTVNGRDLNGSIITPISEGTQPTLFKKGGKVKKICKAQPGMEFNSNTIKLGWTPTRDLLDMQDIITNGKNAITNMVEESKKKYSTTTPAATTTPADGHTKDPSTDVLGGDNTITQGSSVMSSYNFKPFGFMLTELGLGIGSAISGGNKAKKAARLMAEANREYTPYESGRMYSDQHIGRAENAAYKALDNQPMLTSNDPLLTRAFEQEKAKQRVNIADNANAQRSSGITAWNQEEAQRQYRNRVIGNNNQQSAVRAEKIADAQENMIDAETERSVTASLMGAVRDLRTEDLYRTAEKNSNAALDAQTQAADEIRADVGRKYKAQIENDPDYVSKYGGDELSWLADKHPGEYASLMSSYSKKVRDYYDNRKINTGIFAKKGTKLRPTSDMMLIENQKHAHKSIRDLNSNLVKMFLKMMS